LAETFDNKSIMRHEEVIESIFKNEIVLFLLITFSLSDAILKRFIDIFMVSDNLLGSMSLANKYIVVLFNEL